VVKDSRYAPNAAEKRAQENLGDRNPSLPFNRKAEHLPMKVG
jgi:hypothetical protein